MATEVKTLTWCDPCLADDKRTEAATQAEVTVRSAALDANLTRWVDLCDGHAAEFLAPLAEFLIHHGQTAPSNGAAPPRQPVAGANPSQLPTDCPVCHKGYATLFVARMHMASVHGMTREAARRALPTLGRERTGAPMEPCPVCGAEYTRGPGMSSHVRSTHPEQWAAARSQDSG